MAVIDHGLDGVAVHQRSNTCVGTISGGRGRLIEGLWLLSIDSGRDGGVVRQCWCQ